MELLACAIVFAAMILVYPESMGTFIGVILVIVVGLIVLSVVIGGIYMVWAAMGYPELSKIWYITWRFALGITAICVFFLSAAAFEIHEAKKKEQQ